jgi:peptidoglycan/xylan/chitin deacetylase (PgdA/CDA1 family)
MKKLYSLLILSILASSSMSAEKLQYNLLKNANFESGTTQWDSAGSGISISKDSFKGKNAISYTTGGTGQTTDEIPVADGKSEYILSGHYKNIGDVEEIWLGISNLDKNWKTISEKSMSLNKSTTYKTFELKTKPPTGTKYLSLWTWSESKANGKTIIDDLKLKPRGCEITDCNILQNSGFEKNTKSWDVYSTETKLVNDAYKGSKAIHIKEGGLDQMSQDVTGALDTYQFNGYYKTLNNPEGTWAGLNFYDENYNLLFAKTVTLKSSDIYKKFSVSGTSNAKTAYIQAWVWSDMGDNKGAVLFDEMMLSTSGCFNYVAPSSLPPKGIDVKKAPQFVVIGFDDNTRADGIDWALNLFKDKKNADGTEARVSFYMNSKGLDEWIEDDPDELLNAMKRLKASSHEMGNHTYDHQEGSTFDQILKFDKTAWGTRIKKGTDKLTEKIALSKDNVSGFRAPYLIYNQAMFEELKLQNYTYDCSIEEGYATNFNGTNFRWPYQLNNGSPGHNESWGANPENPDHIEIKPIPGLWELPNHVLMIPKDNECAKYGIKKGLWKRIKDKIPYLSDFKITGFDYNLWSNVELNKAEVLGILKYNLDLRLKGNRAPFMFGAHTQYYTDDWSQNAPKATTVEMRAAISEFIKYALSKPEVRIRPAIDIIKWCDNPTPIN